MQSPFELIEIAADCVDCRQIQCQYAVNTRRACNRTLCSPTHNQTRQSSVLCSCGYRLAATFRVACFVPSIPFSYHLGCITQQCTVCWVGRHVDVHCTCINSSMGLQSASCPSDCLYQMLALDALPLFGNSQTLISGFESVVCLMRMHNLEPDKAVPGAIFFTLQHWRQRHEQQLKPHIQVTNYAFGS